MNRLLPRLDQSTVEVLMDELAELAVPELAQRMPAGGLSFTYAPVGGVRVESEFMARLRLRVVDLAAEHGYPDRREQARFRVFEADCARLLHSELSITPHEASHRDVWAALTGAHLLDVAAWRWGGINDRRRVNGDVNRDTFRRLWWRAQLLHDPAEERDGFGGLGEDELVAIMERPVVAGNPIVARAIVRQFVAHLDSDQELQSRRMHLMREGMKRLTRLTPFVLLDALDQVEIDRAVDEVFRESIFALVGRDALRDPVARVEMSQAQVDDGAVVVALPGPAGVAPESDDKVLPEPGDEPAKIALAIAARVGRVTNMTLREATGLGNVDARGVLVSLVERGLLEQRGAKRGTYYVVVQHAADRLAGDDLSASGRTVGSLRRVIDPSVVHEADDSQYDSAAATGTGGRRDGMRRVYIIEIAQQWIPLVAPDARPGQRCYYVGETGLDIGRRFSRHRRGIKSAECFRRIIKAKGAHLERGVDVLLRRTMSDRYESVRTNAESLELEAMVIDELRAEGHIVFPAKGGTEEGPQ